MTNQQNKDFGNEVLTVYPLDSAIEWIKANLDPEQVFDEIQLLNYVHDNYAIDDVYKENEILPYVSQNYKPDDVFDICVLEDWAESNGYTK